MFITSQVYFFVSLPVDSPSANGELCGNSCQEKCFHILQAERRIIILLLSESEFFIQLDFFTGVLGNAVSAFCKLQIVG